MRAPERLGPYVYRQSDTCFPLGGDSLALAAFASVRRGDRVCDLGCGAGALLLLLAARVSPLALSGVEYCPEDAALARQNLAENGLEGAIYTGDLRAVCKTLPAGGFSLAISNPPYFKAGSGGCGGPARRTWRTSPVCFGIRCARSITGIIRPRKSKPGPGAGAV